MLQTYLRSADAAPALAEGIRAAAGAPPRRTLDDEGIQTHPHTTREGRRIRYYSAVVRDCRVETWTMDGVSVVRAGTRCLPGQTTAAGWTLAIARPGEGELGLLRRYLRGETPAVSVALREAQIRHRARGED